MWLNWIVLLSFPYVRCLLYIDRVEVESNPALVNSTLIYFHDATGNCVTTATFTTFFPITKMLLYIKIKFAEDRNDKEYKRQIVSSVVEIDKVLKGLQSNMFIIHFFQDIRNSMDFKFRLPLPPVKFDRQLKLYSMILIFYREHMDSSTSASTRPTIELSQNCRRWWTSASSGKSKEATRTSFCHT